MGREAAKTTVTSLVRDDFGYRPETWDTTVALDRIITAQNSLAGGIEPPRHPLVA